MASTISFAALACSLLAAAAVLAAATPAATAAPWDEKETRMRLYWHDVVSSAANGPTVVTVAEASISNTSATQFGTVMVIDDPLTLEPNLTTSKIIGRAEGIYVSAGKNVTSLLMAMNFVFVEGPYAGSSIAIFGPNFTNKKVREMAVVGGTGVFRFARGYVEAMTYAISNAGDATVQYDIFVRHYG